jgi:diacylglycerol kinase family enzyme
MRSYLPTTRFHFLLCFLVRQNSAHTAIHVIANCKAGRMAAAEERDKLSSLLRSICPDAILHWATDGREVAQFAREAMQNGATLIAAAGGDGTLNAVASVLVGTEFVLGVLPFGTLNHFGRDLGIPVKMDEAIENLKVGQELAIDVGEVNGRIFVNNLGLGLYPEIVRRREERQARGEPKWIAAALATIRSLRQYHRLALQITAAGKELSRKTSIVFLGNNEYSIEGINIGTRTRLDAGIMCLYITSETSALKLIGLSLSALLGILPGNQNYEKILTEDLWIRSRHRTLDVTLDGEVIQLESPLHCRVRPRALRVLVPRER